VIVSIQHKGLKLLWEKNNPTKLPAAYVKKIRNTLTLLDSAVKVEDMNFPGSGLHPLKGELAGFHAVTVTGNWRIIFNFENGDAYLVDYIDYH
jgi:proteic killer suppression protein